MSDRQTAPDGRTVVLQWPVLVGSFLVTFSSMVAPRAILVSTIGLGIVSLVLFALSGGRARDVRLQSYHYWIFGLAVWSMTSAIWSLEPASSLVTGIFVALLAIGGSTIVQSSLTIGRDLTRQSMRGLAWGAVVGGVLLSIDLLTKQALSSQVFALVTGKQLAIEVGNQDHIARSISEVSTYNRRASILMLLFVPTLYWFLRCESGWPRNVGLLAFATCCAIIFSLTESQSAQVGIAAIGIIWLLASVKPKAATILLAVAWIGAITFAVPIAFGLYAAGLQNSPMIPGSFQERVVIWRYVAKSVLEHPIVGIGANASRAADEKNQEAGEGKDKAKTSVELLERGVFLHPHDVYLQIWRELGAIGAVLSLGLGLSILNKSRSFDASLQPMVLAQFAGTAAFMAFSYSIWQSWLLAAIALSATLVFLVHRAKP